MRRLRLAALLVSSVCFAQTSQPPATADEVKYLRFLLLNVASINHSQAAVKAFEDLLVKQFGLNAQESATIHAHGQTLNQTLGQNRRQRGAILAGKTKFRQLLTESGLLGAVGAVLGVAFAWGATRVLLAMVSSGPDLVPIRVRPDAGVLGFTVAVTILTVLLFGAAPGIACDRSAIQGVSIRQVQPIEDAIISVLKDADPSWSITLIAQQDGVWRLFGNRQAGRAGNSI